MAAKLTRAFTDSAAALLAALATALFLGNDASASTASPHELIFRISLKEFFGIFDTVTLAVLLGILILRSPGLKLTLIFWFAINTALYRGIVPWQGGHMGGYLGPLAHTFNLSAGLTNRLLSGVFLYLLAGSAALLIWNLLMRPREIPWATVCPHCGGQIAFSAANSGKTILCPHCRKETRLREPDLLKMACPACAGHLEFPDYAQGRKIPCPHCHLEIILQKMG